MSGEIIPYHNYIEDEEISKALGRVIIRDLEDVFSLTQTDVAIILNSSSVLGQTAHKKLMERLVILTKTDPAMYAPSLIKSIETQLASTRINSDRPYYENALNTFKRLLA